MPPYFTNGMRRRVSSSSSRSEWCPARIRTACCHQSDALLVLAEHPVADLGCLVGRVAAVDQCGPGAAVPVSTEPFWVGAGGAGRDLVGQVEDRLGRAVVVLERDDGRVGEVLRKGEDVLGAGGAEPVDRLRVVADRGQPALFAPELAHDLDLQGVQVLVLVDQHVLEHPPELGSDHVVPGERVPVEQQIVQVEHGQLALPLAVEAKEPGELLDVVLAPGERLGQHRPRAAAAR